MQLVRRLRHVWPSARLISLGNSGSRHQPLTNWCERPHVDYISGLARSPRLQAMVEYAHMAMHDECQRTRTKQRLIGEFHYAAQSWARERSVITRLEGGEQGHNPRFIVTNLDGDAASFARVAWTGSLPLRIGRSRWVRRTYTDTAGLPSLHGNHCGPC